MAEIDELVRRTVATVTTIADKAAAFATKVLVVAAIICVGGFLLGVAALSGGIQTVWIVLGIVFGSIAVGGVLVARWRIGSVKRHVPELADEVRTLLRDGRPGSRAVIDTFVVDPDTDVGTGIGPRPGTERVDRGVRTDGSAILMTRQMHGLRNVSGAGLEGTTRLAAAVTALTTFPFFLLGAMVISLVFGFLGLIFLIALAL